MPLLTLFQNASDIHQVQRLQFGVGLLPFDNRFFRNKWPTEMRFGGDIDQARILPGCFPQTDGIQAL